MRAPRPASEVLGWMDSVGPLTKAPGRPLPENVEPTPEPPTDELKTTPSGARIFRHVCGTPEDDGECMACGQIDCPDGEPLHYHHDGCPCCSQSVVNRDRCNCGGIMFGDGNAHAKDCPCFEGRPTPPSAPCVWRGMQDQSWYRAACKPIKCEHLAVLKDWKSCPYCGKPIEITR